MAQDLKDTLNLPQTNFPMRGNLVEREPERIDHWKKIGLYEKIQAKNSDGKSFILHDAHVLEVLTHGCTRREVRDVGRRPCMSDLHLCQT